MASAARAIPWYRRAGVWIGIATGPGTFTVGGALSAHLPLAWLLLIIPLGALALAGLTVAQGVESRRRRENSTGRSLSAFGTNWGATLLNLIVVLGTLGWFSFYCGLAGSSVANLFNLPPWVGSLVIALGLLILHEIGLDRWNFLVWLTAISTLGVAVFAFVNAGSGWAPDQPATFGVGEFLWGLGSVIAYGLLFALRVGDFSWDLDGDADVVKSGVALLLPLVLFLGIGALTYRAVGDWNMADVLARSKSAALGNIFLILSIIAPALSSPHSGGLAVSSFTPLSRRAGAVLICALGFVLGAARFDRQLLLFLDLLGAFIAPALVVMLLMAGLKNSPGNRVALLAWLAGSAAALLAKSQPQLSSALVGMAVSLAVVGLSLVLTRPRSIQPDKSARL